MGQPTDQALLVRATALPHKARKRSLPIKGDDPIARGYIAGSANHTILVSALGAREFGRSLNSSF